MEKFTGYKEIDKALDALEKNAAIMITKYNDLRERNAELVECLKDLVSVEMSGEDIFKRIKQLIEKNGG